MSSALEESFDTVFLLSGSAAFFQILESEQKIEVKFIYLFLCSRRLLMCSQRSRVQSHGLVVNGFSRYDKFSLLIVSLSLMTCL